MKRILVLLVFALSLGAQVYSPNLLRTGQPDSTNLKRFADTICAQANAHTDREKAEAIWRFFLTDGRFVQPGYWYHIAGWTYEEPSGEVLDPLKLLNSYGFGLCYHIAPLLAAVFDAAGFENSRCWFLTGHTVTEVFYDGGYHYFDSDMMGYNVAGDGPFQGKPVASVRDLEQYREILLAKLAAPDKVKPGVVDQPWYPADVRARAMGDMADLFSSTQDNYLYPFTRYSPGHSMDFILRPGETLTRFFKPEEPTLYYLPFRFDGTKWEEFPKEIAEYNIKTLDGPRSQKDGRLWATGRFDYVPPKITTTPVSVIEMPSPYVIIDASFTMDAKISADQGHLAVETSTDNGVTWLAAGELSGKHSGAWTVQPKVLSQSAHGRLTAVSGTYGYAVRLTKSPDVAISALHLISRVQVNPRALPYLVPGQNHFVYDAGPALQHEEIAIPMDKAKLTDMTRVEESGQSLLVPNSDHAEAIYTLASDTDLVKVDVGARFLDLRDGLAPDKLTAETRHTKVVTRPGVASIAWSLSPAGPFTEIWKYNPDPVWRDGDAITRLLRWPEVFQQIQNLPAGTKQIFVKLQSSGPAIDNIRIGLYSRASGTSGLTITQVWKENGQDRRHVEQIKPGETSHEFAVSASTGVENTAVIFAAP